MEGKDNCFYHTTFYCGFLKLLFLFCFDRKVGYIGGHAYGEDSARLS